MTADLLGHLGVRGDVDPVDRDDLVALADAGDRAALPGDAEFTLQFSGSRWPITANTTKARTMASRKCMVEPATATSMRCPYVFWRYVRASSSGGTSSMLLMPMICT